MSCEQFAFIHREKVPSRDTWQAAIEASGFDFVIDHELTPFEHDGFLPCTLQGHDAGVEISYFEVTPIARAPKNSLAKLIFRFYRSIVGRGWENRLEQNQAANAQIFSAIAQGRDYCISFRWSSSGIECASAMILSYALAHDFGAIVSYECNEPYESLDDFYKDTLSCIEDTKNENY